MRSRGWVFAGAVLLGVSAGWLVAQRRLTYHRRDLFSRPRRQIGRAHV